MPSKSEWESQKDVIRELYLNQDYTLRALRDRMNTAGFVATKSQYETKFKAWGFSKNDTNIPAATWKHVGYKVAKRKREDEDSAVFIEGREVDQKRVKKEISRYRYSTVERVQLESIGAPSPPGPLAVVATPPSSQQAFNINHWPESLPWLAFARSLNTTLPIFRQPNKTPRSSQHGLATTQSRAQTDILLRNDATPNSGNWQRLANVTTRRERLNLIQAILPRSSDPERVPEIQNSMSLLSTTSSHWGLKLLIYLASNNLLQPRDLDHIWRLVEETGIKELASLSVSLRLGETSLTAALEYLFEAGVSNYCTDIVSWLLDIGIDPNRRIRSQDLNGLHLPIVVALLGLHGGRWRRATSMAHLLLSKGALVLLPCCEEHNTATHLAVINEDIDEETLELFLQAASKAQSQKLGSQHPKSVSQEDTTNSDDCEAQKDQDPVSVMLESLLDVAAKLLDGDSPSCTSIVSPETLIKAVEYNNHTLMRILHSRGLSINCCDADQASPLERGIFLVGGSVEVSTIELLLELGASPNYEPCPDNGDLCSGALETAIHYSSYENQAEVVGSLIRNGANIQGSVSCGIDNHQNLMDCALRVVPGTEHLIHDDVPAILYEAGLPFPKTCLLDYLASIHTQVAEGVFDSDPELGALIPILISVTTDMSLQSEIGWTALDYAFKLHMKEAAELMLEKGAMHSHTFIHDHCLSGYLNFKELETLFRRVPFLRSDKQRRGLLFYRIIGTLRALDLRGDALILGVRDLIQDYCKLPRSQKHEAYIIQEACATGNMSLIGLVLETFPSTYSPAAIDELIQFQTERGIDNWKFIEKLLKQRLNIFSPSQRLRENRMFLQAVSAALTCKDNSKVLEWFHNNSQEPFELANLHPSAFFMNVIQSSTRWITNLWHLSDKLKHLNMNQFYKNGLKTSAYLGLLAVFTGRVGQISDLLHNGMRPNGRFPWSLTALQLAVAREDLPMSRRLLEAGADVNARPPWRDIPESIRRRIPEKVCKVLTTDYSEGYTKRRSALQLAMERGDLPMIILLLENGADINGPPARVGGATALQIACMKGYIDITKLLIKRGAVVNGAGAEYLGRTALEGAAEHGRLDTIFLLLESGCLVHGSFRKQYIRAVGFARAEAHHTVAKKLQDYGDWTNDDEEVLSSTDLRDIEPEYRDLEEELHDDEDISEVDSEDLKLWREPDPFPFEMDSESEVEDYSSAEDDEDTTSSGQSTPKGILDECGSSERGTEPQDVPPDTWDDMIDYDGDNEGAAGYLHRTGELARKRRDRGESAGSDICSCRSPITEIADRILDIDDKYYAFRTKNQAIPFMRFVVLQATSSREHNTASLESVELNVNFPMEFACGTCWRTWPSWRSRDQHVAAKYHKVPDFECDTCNRYFGSQRAVEQHMDALGHWRDSSDDEQFYCDFDACSEVFDDEDELRDHEVEDHFYCDPCDRHFQSLNNIKMHRNGRAHRGTNANCPFCRDPFVTASGVFHHLEQGGCPKAPLNRTQVYEAVRRKDPNGVLTQRLRDWSTTTLEATVDSWNRYSQTYDCPLCGDGFRRLDSLNQHLQSPKHQKLYHCPKPSCRKQFGSLAAVTEHLQSESCGFMKFEQVQETAKRIFDPGRMIGF